MPFKTVPFSKNMSFFDLGGLKTVGFYKKKLFPASWSGLCLKPVLDEGSATVFLYLLLTKFCDSS